MAHATQAEKNRYSEQAAQAAVAARKAADAAAKAARDAKDWAKPRAEEAYRSTARKASPYVHRAGARGEHWADVVHGAIVGAAIPAVIAAVDRAANFDEPRRRGNTWVAVVVPIAIAAAAGAALVVWARRDPNRTDWAGDDDWEFLSDEGDFPSRVRHDINKVADLTTDAAKKAATAVAGAATVVGDKAAPMVSQVKEVATEQGRKVAASVEIARGRAAEALEDVEDVWEDDGGQDEAPPAKKPRAATKKAAS